MRESLERFYGTTVPDDVVDHVVERLTDHQNDDLVAAHIGRNWSYFGAIDKTLAGFVILDDEGDNYTLWDARDTGQVWWQDHETRDLELQTDSIADYAAWQEAVAQAEAESEDWVDRDEYLAEFEAAGPRAERAVSTPELLERYQWLVWAAAQPMEHRGVVTESIDDLVRDAVGRFTWKFETNDDIEGAFDAELATLADDPHLAIYWLLHAMFRVEPHRADAVVDALPDERPALLQAFVDAAADIDATHDLPQVPDFRARKAWMHVYLSFRKEAPDLARAMLEALEMESEHESYFKAFQAVCVIEAEQISAGEVADALERMDREQLGPLLLETVVAEQSDADPGPAAAKAIGAIDDPDRPWSEALEVLWRTYRHVPAEVAAPVAARLGDIDPYHMRVAQMVADIAAETEHDGLPDPAAAAERLEHAEQLMPLLMPLFDDDSNWLAVVNELPEHLELPAALRILVWPDVCGEGAVGWAIQRVLRSDLDDRIDIVRDGLGNLGGNATGKMLEQVAARIEGPEDQGVDLLFAVLSLPAPPPGDYGKEWDFKEKIKAAVKLIAPLAKDDDVFDRVMTVLESEPAGKVVDNLVTNLFSPFEKETYLVADLSDEQAVRVAKALIELKQSDDIHAANAAGHQLYRFNHAGAEGTIREALEEYGARYVEDDSLKDLVANLYASLRSMGTESSRDAIVERLFDERRSYWRLGSALADLFYGDILDRAIAAIRERNEPHAAAAYAAAMRHHCNDDGRMVELGVEAVTWPTPDDDTERGMLAYAMHEVARSAITLRKFDLVKSAWARAEDLGEPYSPYHAIDRGSDWTSPFDTDEGRSDLEWVLSGKAEAQAESLREAAAAAREAGERNLDISDEDLSLLASGAVRERLFEDTETGEIWFQDPTDAFHYFDGFDVVEPPFDFVINPTHDPRDFFGDVAVTDRVMFWDTDAKNFIEYVQWGPKIISYRGVNNGRFDSWGAVFPDAASAADLMAAVRRNVPEGFGGGDPWYVPAKGAVVRKYYRPLPGGGWNSDGSQYQAVLNGQWCWGDVIFESDEAAVDALHEYERETFAEHGGVVSRIEWSSNYRRDEDLELVEWMERRTRNDARGGAWHLRAMSEIVDYLQSHGLGHLLEGFAVEVGAPAPPDEIETFAAACSQPVHPALLEAWGEVGSARWSLGGRAGQRWLSPGEVLKNRDVARAAGQSIGRGQSGEPWAALDALVVNADGAPTLVYSDTAQPDARQFANLAEDGQESWWQENVGWCLATGMVAEFVERLLEAQPVLGMLHYGQSWHDSIRYERVESGDNFFEVLADPEFGWLATRAGKAGGSGRVENDRLDGDAVFTEADSKLDARLDNGWERVGE